MAKVLILFAHPTFQQSKVNQGLLKCLPDLEDVTIHDLYEAYPDFYIDIKKEQQLLLDHDVIVLQHPFYWYNCPALLKEWLDRVLEHGFAYGSHGKQLVGKKLISVISAGGSQFAYTTKLGNQISRSLLLLPFTKTADLCDMIYYPPFVIFGTHSINDEKFNHACSDYQKLIQLLTNDQLVWSQVKDLEHINTYLAQKKGGI